MADAAKQTAPKTAALPGSVFAVDVPNHELLKLAYDSYLANGRVATANTKTRGEVSGGGKKPWRQKGTGRARFGSTRNPIWRHGGIVFGPTGQENYVKKISKQSKHVALRQALTLASQADKVVVNELPSTVKTKDIAAFLDNHKASANRVLLVVAEKTPEMIRASRNLSNVLLVRANYLSVFHILNADKIVMNNAAVKATEAWLGEGGSK